MYQKIYVWELQQQATSQNAVLVYLLKHWLLVNNCILRPNHFNTRKTPDNEQRHAGLEAIQY